MYRFGRCCCIWDLILFAFAWKYLHIATKQDTFSSQNNSNVETLFSISYIKKIYFSSSRIQHLICCMTLFNLDIRSSIIVSIESLCVFYNYSYNCRSVHVCILLNISVLSVDYRICSLLVSVPCSVLSLIVSSISFLL